MAPKPSSSSSKKKVSSSSTSSDEVKQPKFKLPSNFITRPTTKTDYRSIPNVVLNNKVMKALEINAGSMCVVSKEGENGVVAIAQPGDDGHPVNVIQISSPLRSVGNLVLGDRLELKKITTQPAYASSVTLGSLKDSDFPPDAKKSIEKLASG